METFESMGTSGYIYTGGSYSGSSGSSGTSGASGTAGGFGTSGYSGSSGWAGIPAKEKIYTVTGRLKKIKWKQN